MESLSVELGVLLGNNTGFAKLKKNISAKDTLISKMI
jgi:hypothetical protein